MRNFVRITCCFAVSLFAAVQGRAQVLATDDFSYANGDLPTVSSGAWSLYSGTAGAGDVQVTNGMAFASGVRTGDDGLSFGGTHTNDQVFAGFDAVVLNWSPTAASAYFALFKDSSTFNFFARTFVTNVTGGVQFGITGSATTLPVSWSPTVALGSTNRVVIEVDQTGTFVTGNLYLNGLLVASNTSTNNSGFSISQFGLRESNATTMGTVGIDNLIIGSTFADVVPEPSTMLLVGMSLVGLLAVRRRRS